MKIKLKISFSILFLWLAIAGCEPSFDQENCTEENKVALETINVEGINFEGCRLVDAPRGQNFQVVIKSQSELEKNIQCSSGFQSFDFNKYFIVVGQYAHQNCILFDSQVVSICQNTIFYEVFLQEQVCQSPTDVMFLAIVDRKYKDFDVVLNIKLK